MSIAMIIAPAWYLDERNAGKSAEALRDKVRQFCLAALSQSAAARGEPPPQTVDEALVDLTIDSYEYAMSLAESEPH